MEREIWSARPSRNAVLKLADFPKLQKPTTNSTTGLTQVERIPSLKELLVDKTNSRFSESIADIVGRTIIRGHYTPSIRTENNFPDKFDPIE